MLGRGTPPTALGTRAGKRSGASVQAPRSGARLAAYRRSQKRAEAGCDRDDHDAGEGHDPEGAHERVLEEAPAQIREREELERDDADREEEGGMVVRDEEGQRVQDPAEERAAVGDRATHDRAAAARELP